MRILVAGPPISGKSSLRRYTLEVFRAANQRADHYDADRFNRPREARDADCLNALDGRKTLVIIEDVHAFSAKAVAPIDSYDAVLYLAPNALTSLRLLLTRARVWYRKGLFDYDLERGGWRGTGRSRDPWNFFPIARTALGVFTRRPFHHYTDGRVLRRYRGRLLIVRPRIRRGKLTFPCVSEFFAI